MKRILATLGAGLLAMAICGCGNQTSAQKNGAAEQGNLQSDSKDQGDDVYTLKIGVVITDTDPLYAGLQEMQKQAEEKSEGRLKIELYPSSQLGDTSEVIEQAVAGANVGTIAGSSQLEGYCKDFGIVMGPYIMKDYEECLKLIGSDLYSQWVDEIAGSGLRLLSFNYQQGERFMVTKKEVRHPEDLKGLMIRTFSSELPLGAIEMTGATGSTLAWSEVYSGIQQKVIDGCEAQISAVSGSALTEVAPYVAKTGHFQMLSGLVVGNAFYNSLPEDLQKILVESSVEGGTYASDMVYKKAEDYERELTEKGAVFTEVDKEEWAASMDPIYDKLGLRELKNQIDEILAE